MWGQGPYTASCEEAVRNIGFIPPHFDESQELRWALRGLPVVKDVGLPQEVVSCKHLAPEFKECYQLLMRETVADGHCRINVHLDSASDMNVARASQSQVKAGVSAIIDNCMRNRARPVGGAVKKISER